MQTTIDEISTTTTINAPIDRVWEAITTPSQIKQWFFGVDTESAWTVGSQLVHTGEYEGKPYVDKGEILRIEPARLLEHSHWSEVSGKPDRPDQYQVVTWALAEHGGGTELTVSERNLPSKEAAETSEDAWKMALGKAQGPPRADRPVVGRRVRAFPDGPRTRGRAAPPGRRRSAGGRVPAQ